MEIRAIESPEFMRLVQIEESFRHNPAILSICKSLRVAIEADMRKYYGEEARTFVAAREPIPTTGIRFGIHTKNIPEPSELERMFVGLLELSLASGKFVSYGILSEHIKIPVARMRELTKEFLRAVNEEQHYKIVMAGELSMKIRQLRKKEELLKSEE